MKHLRFTLAVGAVLATIACTGPSEDPASPKQPQLIASQQIGQGELIRSDGAPAGRLKLVSDGEAVTLSISASNLPEGKHGFHLHQTGQCDGPDFKSAGGHLNPLGKEHGTESKNGSHVGDLSNLDVSAANSEPQEFAVTGTVEQITDWIFDADGTAVVVHADPDDYKTDPSGAAGARIACAVLTRTPS